MVSPALGYTNPPIQHTLGVLWPGIKWQVHEVHHSSPPSAKVKNEWNYTSNPCYMSSWYRDNFTSALLSLRMGGKDSTVIPNVLECQFYMILPHTALVWYSIKT